MKYLAQTALLTLFLVTPVALAQTGTNADSTNTATVVTTHDNTGLWGLLGLLGLGGLAGLRRQPTGLVSTDHSGTAKVRT